MKGAEGRVNLIIHKGMEDAFFFRVDNVFGIFKYKSKIKKCENIVIMETIYDLLQKIC